AVEVGIGFALVPPGEARRSGRLHPGQRHVDQRMAALAARLDQRHARARVRAQPVGEDAPGAARADDDVIELFHSAPPSCWIRPTLSAYPARRGWFSRSARVGEDRLQLPALELAFS